MSSFKSRHSNSVSIRLHMQPVKFCPNRSKKFSHCRNVRRWKNSVFFKNACHLQNQIILCLYSRLPFSTRRCAGFRIITFSVRDFWYAVFPTRNRNRYSHTFLRPLLNFANLAPISKGRNEKYYYLSINCYIIWEKGT